MEEVVVGMELLGIEVKKAYKKVLKELSKGKVVELSMLSGEYIIRKVGLKYVTFRNFVVVGIGKGTIYNIIKLAVYSGYKI